MVRSIKVSPKSVFFSTCLLLVLLAGVMAQTAAQSTNMTLDLTVDGLLSGGLVSFQAVVNGKPYCIYGYPNSTSPILPLNFTVNEGMEGYCSPPQYVGGGLVTSGYHPSQFSVLGWITIGLQGHTVTVVVDLTAGGIKIQSKFTGNLNLQDGTCTFSNVVSQYTSVTGAGLNLNLQPLAYTGTCSVPGVITLGLTFGNAAAAVGGVVIPVNTFAVLAPWLAVIGLVGCIGTIVAVTKKR